MSHNEYHFYRNKLIAVGEKLRRQILYDRGVLGRLKRTLDRVEDDDDGLELATEIEAIQKNINTLQFIYDRLVAYLPPEDLHEITERGDRKMQEALCQNTQTSQTASPTRRSAA